MTPRADRYEDFAAWRKEPTTRRADGHVTVGDAMRYFTGTPIPVILDWFSRWRDSQAPAVHSYQIIITRTVGDQGEVCRVTSAGPTGHDALLRVADAIHDGTMHAGDPCGEKS